MKLLKNCLFFLLISLVFENNVFPLSNYQIKQICKKEKKISNCIKNLKFKKLNLEKGNQIEIPVIPFKK